MAASPALRSLEATLAMVSAMLKIESKFKDPPSAADMAAVEGLRAGCAVLIVAAFEEFLKSCFRDELMVFQGRPHNFIKLPEAFQVSIVFKQLDRAMKGRGKQFDRLPEIFLASTRVHNKEIFPEALNSTNSNPSPETVIALFKDVAFADVFSVIKPRFERLWGNPVSHAFPKDKLEEIVQRRHRVAHTGRALSVTRVELRESTRFVKKLAQTLELELRAHLRTVWRNSR